MKNRYKNKLICILITLIISSFTIPITNITANAADINSKDIDWVILFDDNSIDKNVEKIITNSGGKVVEEFPELGGIEVKCSSDLNYGEDFIDISAPGGDLLNINEDDGLCLTTTIDGDYTFTAGTSIAAPKVSAVAALIICQHKGY